MATPNDYEYYYQVAPPEQRHNAVRAVAGAARDAEDCAELLDMLGLSAADGVTTGKKRKKRRPTRRHAA